MLRLGKPLGDWRTRKSSLEVIREAYKNGGATLHAETLEPVLDVAGGYAVALHGFAATREHPTYANSTLGLYLEQYAKLAHSAGHKYIGIWYEGREIVFDRVEIVFNREEAFRLAREHQQDAIFDFDACESIYLTNPEVPQCRHFADREDGTSYPCTLDEGHAGECGRGE